MKEDLLPFLLGVGLLIAYLVFSAISSLKHELAKIFTLSKDRIQKIWNDSSSKDVHLPFL